MPIWQGVYCLDGTLAAAAREITPLFLQHFSWLPLWPKPC